MSDFVRILNSIKTRHDPSWLTPSQQEALVALRKALRLPGAVNLFGSAGVGKTFVAWVLADEVGYIYLPHISRLTQIDNSPISGVIVDNCQPERQAHRDTLKLLSFGNVCHAVLISRQLIRDYTQYVELKLTPDDLAHVQNRLAALGFFRETIEVPNLWHLLNPHL